MRVTAIRKLFLLGRLSPLSLDLRWFFVYLKNQCKLRLSSFNNECVKKSILDQKKKKKNNLDQFVALLRGFQERKKSHLPFHSSGPLSFPLLLPSGYPAKRKLWPEADLWRCHGHSWWGNAGRESSLPIQSVRRGIAGVDSKMHLAVRWPRPWVSQVSVSS